MIQGMKRVQNSKGITAVMNIVRTVVVAGLVMFLLYSGEAFAFSFGYNDGYEPTQPIPYNHALHAGKYQIPCLHCHVQANKNRHATVPSLNICLNCHRNVAIDKPTIQKITKAHDSGFSIPWLKVHLLPDFVKFNHQPHIQAGVRCQTCHGPIQEMEVVYQHSDLSMGWCVNCHREPEAARELGWDEKENLTDVTKQAPVSCGTCHY